MTKHSQFRFLFAGILLMCLTAVGQSTWYVRPDAEVASFETRDGLTWETAMTLSEACVAVTAGTTSDWHEIVLKGGTAAAPLVYDFSEFPTGGVANASAFSIAKDYVCVRSDANDPRTIELRGGFTNNLIRCFSLGDNTITLSGLSIANWAVGSAEANAAHAGAGVRCASNSKNLISNCVFSTCQSTSAGAAVYKGLHIANTFITCGSGRFHGSRKSGGAVFDALQMTDCRFVDCYTILNATIGSCFGSSQSTYDLVRCVFESNRVSACIGNESNSSAAWITGVTNCLFRANKVVSAVAGWGSKLYFRNCRFCDTVDNAVTGHGSYYDCLIENCTNSLGVVLGEAGWLYRCTITRCANNSGNFSHRLHLIEDCVISNNTSAGHMFYELQGHTATSCAFIDNTVAGSFVAGNYGSAGGNYVTDCVFVGNRMSGGLTSSQSLTDCLVFSNVFTTVRSVFGESITVRGCTVVSNKVQVAAVEATNSDVANCLIVDNDPADICWTQTWSKPGTMTNCVYKTYSKTYDGNRSYVTTGLLVQVSAPRFSARDAAHPWGCLPRRTFVEVIDKGDSSLTKLSPAPTVDLAGSARLVGASIDIGCYEYKPVSGMALIVR